MEVVELKVGAQMQVEAKVKVQGRVICPRHLVGAAHPVLPLQPARTQNSHSSLRRWP